MPRLSFSSLRVRLILLVLIAVIPALGMIIYSNLDQRRHAAKEVKMNALRFTRMAGGNVERFIEGTHQMLNALTYAYIVRNRDQAACNQQFAALLKQNPHYNNIGATDAAGNIFASAVPYKRPVNFADRLWFRRVVQTRNFAVGEFQVGRITGKHTLVFSYPVLGQRGTLLGTVYAATDLTWLNQAIKDISLPADSSVTVLDRRGTIITRYPDPEKWAGKTLPEANVIKMILERKEGVTEAAGIDGVTRLYAFTPLRGIAENGIYLGTGLSKASAFAEINRDLVRNLAWLGLVALFALAAAWVGGDLFVLRKVKVLLATTKRLRNGDLTARTELPYQNGEISQLARTFDEMAEAIEQRDLALQVKEARLEEAQHLAHIGGWELDPITNVLVWSDEIYRIFEIDPQAFGASYQAFLDTVHPDDRRMVDRAYTESVKNKTPYEIVHRLLMPDGRVKFVHERCETFYDADGTPRRSIGTVQDISERKQAEERLGKETERSNILLELYMVAPTLTDKELYDYALDKAVQLTESAIGFFHLVSEDQRNIILTTWNREALKGCTVVYDTHYPLEKAGNWVDCVRFGRPVIYNDFPNSPNQKGLPEGHSPVWRFMSIPVWEGDKIRFIFGVGNKMEDYEDRDVVQIQLVASELQKIVMRRRAEESLRLAGAYNRSLIEASLDPLVTIDAEGKITDVNSATEKITGYSRQELIDTDFSDYFTEPEKARVGYQEVFEKGFVQDYALEIRRRDGNVTPVLYNASLYRDEAEKIQGIFAAARDITERKRLEAQLLQAQKMEAVGTLAGGVAHDFNNLLTAIMSNLELAKFKIDQGQPVKPYVEEIEKVTEHAAQLIQQLLAFSRRQLLQLVPLNLNDTIARLGKMLSRLIGEYIELDLRLAAGLGMVKADPGQIEQVIMNLVVNARDAMPTGGKLTLRTQNVHLDESYIKEHPFVRMGDYVMLEVADTGGGMDKATLARIFEPFFTTKEVGKGTGLGLSTVFGIVKQHEGYINVYSEPDQGSIFKIYLPRREKEAMVEEVQEVPLKIEGGKETVLLAEDEGPLREAIKNILEMFGYTVLAAEDGQAAVEIYQREGEGIDLVILDAVMPKMGGVEVAEWINKINPSQKILFSSGYTAEGIHEKFVIPEKMHFIQKPYTAKDLARKIREVLEK